MPTHETFPALYAVSELEDRAAQVHSCPPRGQMVHGLVQGGEYYFRVIHERFSAPEADPVQQWDLRRERQAVFTRRRGKLAIYLTEAALDEALETPGQRRFMAKRRDSGLLEVHTIPAEVAEQDDHGATLYSNQVAGTYGAFRETPYNPNEWPPLPGPHGTSDTPEGRAVIKKVTRRILEVAEAATDVTRDL